MSFNGTIFPVGGLSTSANVRTGNIGIGTTVLTSASLTVFSSTQLLPRVILSGQEFVNHGNTGENNFTSNGIAFLLGVNRTNNRQLWIANSDYLTSNTTNPVLRIQPNPTNGTCFIDSIATDGLTSLKLSLGNSASQTLINGNVGIGTDNPQQRLAVVGNSYFNGNVGIGTTNPTQQLHLQGGALYITGNSGITGDTASASFWNLSGVGPTIAGANIAFQTNGSTERMRINSSGNVGIGTNNPGSYLSLNIYRQVYRIK
jgi:hypothetical protein